MKGGLETYDTLWSLVDLDTTDHLVKELAKLFLQAMQDWPTRNSNDISAYVSQLKQFFGEPLNQERIESKPINTLTLWQIESAGSLVQMLTLAYKYDGPVNLDEVVDRILLHYNKEFFLVDFFADLHYRTTEEGGRKTPAASGYRPHLKFPFSEEQTSGQQTFIDQEMAYPGDRLSAKIKVLWTDLLAGKLEEGTTFEFREGRRVIGSGKVTYIVNDKLEKEQQEKPTESFLFQDKQLDDDKTYHFQVTSDSLEGKMKTLKEIYFATLSTITPDAALIAACFDEVASKHQEAGRHYHNLEHLKALFTELKRAEHLLEDPILVNLAVFYHDVVYSTVATDNEEKSAEFGRNHLQKMGAPNDLIEKVCEAIIATKTHAQSENNDVNLFTDADLSILGCNEEEYQLYAQKIRYEYLIYPGFLFDKGRIKALSQLCATGKIYKTDHFIDLYETAALRNLQQELKSLQNRTYTFVQEDGTYVQYLEFDGDLSEFFSNAVKLLDQTNGVNKIQHYPGWHDSGYYVFTYREVPFRLEYEGMLGTSLRTEPNSSANDRQVADELFEQLLEVRLSDKDLDRLNDYFTR